MAFHFLLLLRRRSEMETAFDLRRYLALAILRAVPDFDLVMSSLRLFPATAMADPLVVDRCLVMATDSHPVWFAIDSFAARSSPFAGWIGLLNSASGPRSICFATGIAGSAVDSGSVIGPAGSAADFGFDPFRQNHSAIAVDLDSGRHRFPADSSSVVVAVEAVVSAFALDVASTVQSSF